VTSGSWRLTTSVKAQGTTLPTGGVKAVPMSVPTGQTQTLGYGTASGQCNLQVVTKATLAAGASTTLDLYGGSVLDIFGAAAAFRELRAVVVWVESGGDSTGVVVGDDGVVTNPAPLFLSGTTPRVTVYPSGPAFSAGSPAGATVDATHKNLKITNAGAVAVTVVVALSGSNA
jgi:hypothetical protein